MAELSKTHSLYNKYRPKIFNDVFGQETAITILKNSIKLDRINHAYLFTGIRGIGKTTLARIFAKAINCDHLTKDYNPCNECDSCNAINESNSLDVVEIDAASNNGVEEIRNLKEKANYILNSKYKIFIIDEIHMLSKSAFNAFLKLLEEPPKNVVFILLTTEINKIPDTILSRTLTIQLETPSNNIIKKTIEDILKKEKIKFNNQIISEISILSEGSIRDALSILEKLITNLKDRALTYEQFIKIMNLPDSNFIESIILEEDKEKLVKFIFENNNNIFNLMNYFSNKVIELLLEKKINNTNYFFSFAKNVIDTLIVTNDPKILFNKIIFMLTDRVESIKIVEVQQDYKNTEKLSDSINNPQVISFNNKSQNAVDVFLKNEKKINNEYKNSNRPKKFISKEYKDFFVPEIFFKLIINIDKNAKNSEIFNEIYKTVFTYSTHHDWKKYVNLLKEANFVTVDENYILISFKRDDLYEQFKEYVFDNNLLDFMEELFNDKYLLTLIKQKELANIKKFINHNEINDAQDFFNKINNFKYPDFLKYKNDEKKKLIGALNEIFGETVEVVKENE